MITAVNAADNDKMGQRDGLSVADIKLARAMYNCDGEFVSKGRPGYESGWPSR